MTNQRAEERLRHIEALEAWLGDARDGLPEEVFRFVSRLTPLVNVDLLVKDGEGRTLLTWRDDHFYGPGWHVPGSIIRYKEPAIDRVHQCAREELGAEVDPTLMPIFVMESIVGDRTRGHFISLLFECRLLTGPHQGRRTPPATRAPGQWQWHARPPANLISERAR